MKSGLPLKQVWTALVLFAVLVPATVVIIWFGQKLYTNELNSALGQERQANELLKQQIESEVRRFKTLLTNKSDPLAILLNKSDVNSRADLNGLLRLIVKRETAIRMVIILSPRSEVLAVIDPALGVMDDALLSAKELQAAISPWKFSGSDGFPEVIIPMAGRMYIGSPQQHKNFTAFNLAIPIGEPVRAVLIAKISVEEMWSNRVDFHRQQGMDVATDYMLDRRGSLMTHIADSDYNVGDLVTHLGIARAALIDGVWLNQTTYLGMNKQTVFGTLTAIPELNWSLISEISVASVLGPIWLALLQVIVVTLFALLGFVLLILYLAGKTLEPIRAACTAIDHVALGNYDYVLETCGIRELDAMTRGFNDMVLARQRGDDLLRRREQDLAVTLNCIGDAVITTDAEGKILRMNPVAEKLTGWPLVEAVGKPLSMVFSIVDGSTRQPVLTPVEKVIVSGETIHRSNHIMLISKDGTEYQIADSAAPIRNESQVLGMVLVFSDVTEQYRIKNALANKELEQREILNAIVDAVITIDDKAIVLSFSTAAEKLFGYAADEVIGHNISMLMAAAYADQHDSFVGRFLSTGEAKIIGSNREVEGLKKNKDVFPMRLSVAELPLDGEGNRRFVGSCQDLTRIKEQDEQLRRAQKMDALGQLTGGIAHDYNNMLGIILGYSELLLAALDEQPKLKKYASEIYRAGERGASLTRKILAFSRHSSPDSQVVNVNALLLEQRMMLEKTLTVRITLVFDLDDDLWSVWLDAGELEDAVVNLSINAMHAIVDRGELCLRTYNESLNSRDAQWLGLAAGDYVVLSVTDTGCGMNDDTKERVFDPFYSTKGDKGTGLGLSQVYGFVQRSGGTVKVYSELEHGSRFTLYFPRERGRDADVAPVSIPDKRGMGGEETLLVVDDEPGLVLLAQEILSAEGYTVLTAADGEEALLLLENEAVAVVITDIIMPNMDGYAFAAQVQQRYPHIKIQMVSGFAGDHHQGTGIIDESERQILKKPYTAESLLLAVRGLLDEGKAKSDPF